MLDFRRSTPEDKQWIDEILKNSRHQGCVYTFAQTYIWAEKYNTQVCRYKNALLIKGGYDESYYMYPAGEYDIADVVDALKKDSEERGVDFAFAAVEHWQAQELGEAFPERFACEEERDSFDYIYLSSDLISLAGRKYHGKRNHISKFLRKHPDCSYEDITPENIEQCRDAARLWFEQNSEREGIGDELEAIERALDHFFEFEFIGGMLRADERIIAFTIGERLNSDSFVVHFEKALEGYEEAYTVINNRFAAMRLSDYKYINREEDMGIEGLRKAKLSYHPHLLLKKYYAYEVTC